MRERHARVAAMHDANHKKSADTVAQRSGESPIALPFLAAEMWEVIKDTDWVLGNGNLRGWTERLWDYRLPASGHRLARRRRTRHGLRPRGRRRPGQPR